MTMENEIKELKRLARATGALVFALFSVFPMFVLGWLASAIARHPEAEKSIAAEPVYEFLVWWQGGLKTFPLIFILMFYLLIFFALSYAFVKHGYSHPVDGLKKSSVVLRKFLIPAYLSFAAFGGGIFGGDSISAMNNSFIVVGVLSAFAGFIFYVIDIDEIE